MTTATGGRTAARLLVEGRVQGVGFRPFVYREATARGLVGWVRNTSRAVEIVVEGDAASVADFADALRTAAPRLAHIERVVRETASSPDTTTFTVAISQVEAGRLAIPPDLPMCDHCAAELRDPANRRYRYPFITCTDCGPRFSVIEAMPYDRERTSMRAFAMCPACLAEYGNPADRRFHSETNSCPACGPRLWLADTAGTRITDDPHKAIAGAAALLRRGEILALRGLGGFHLACDATSEDAVRRLRARKSRDAKPLAVMVADLVGAARLIKIDPGSLALDYTERPVLVAPRRESSTLAASLAPGLDSLGVMLAYTPLHLLLLEACGRPLVMTSGNRSDEPIAIGNAEAQGRLAGVADAFLFHDREIVARYDDSVVRHRPVGPVIIRRARGLAPDPLTLPVAARQPILAVGAHLKNTLALASGSRVWVSQHIGDLDDLAGIAAFEAVRERYQSLFAVTPEVVARDAHPGYASTRIAGDTGLRQIVVQHHHAHVAAVMAEHGRIEPVIGVAFDGTGLGDDGRIWGAEFLVADLVDYRRVGQLRYAAMPGGDLAARRPWRSALAYASLVPALEDSFVPAFSGVDTAELVIARMQIARQLNAPAASSMGRLFDAAAALLGIRHTAAYEGQAAMELEAAAGNHTAPPLPFPFTRDEAGTWVMDPVPLLASLGERRKSGANVAWLAAQFHESIALTTAEIVRGIRDQHGLTHVALCGGSFQNLRLLNRLSRLLEADGFNVLTARRLPPNDGAISCGQAAVAAARLARED